MNLKQNLIRMGQYGTKHAHAGGILQVMLENKDVEVSGVYEPDITRRRSLQNARGYPWNKVHWFEKKTDLLNDDKTIAISSEGLNEESLTHTEEIVEAGNHGFYDKPAGEDFPRFKKIIKKAKEKNLLIQLGYMFRNHEGFSQIAKWAKNGLLGDIYAIRAHMSTNIPDKPVQNPLDSRSAAGNATQMSAHKGGIFYDLAVHMLDQIVFILNRPEKITSFLRNEFSSIPNYCDNTLSILEYPKAYALIESASMEATPAMARRFEVYGNKGSAIMEPFEPAETIRLCLSEKSGKFSKGVHIIKIKDLPRHVASLESFVKNIRRESIPDRTLDHELLVQETLLRCTNIIK